MKVKALLISSVIASAVCTTMPAFAQDYPNKPVHVITTTSAGGLSDIFMRGLGDELSKRWGQPLIVENRPGGSQNIGARACTEAPPDGYTICIINADAVIYNQFLFKSLPFDPEKGLQPINLFYLIHRWMNSISIEKRRRTPLSKAPGKLNYSHGAP